MTNVSKPFSLEIAFNMSNYSIYAIPAFVVLALFPHAYATRIIKNANNQQWNNANPRSAALKESAKKSLPASIYARYERAEAAHANSMENLPLLIGAIILGNMAKLSVSLLNTVAGAYLALRIAYTYAYINTETVPNSFIRSALWATSLGSLLYLIIRAGNELA